MQQYVFLNDRWVAPEEAVVSVEDRGFQLGDGIYEVVRVYGGKPFALQQHVDRLARSARELELPLPATAESLADIIREAPARRNLCEAQVYIQVTRGAAGRVHHFPPSVEPTLVAYASEARVQPPEAYAEGLTAIVVSDERWLRCDIKSIMLLANGLAKEKARRAGAIEALLERDGIGITEGSSSNLFIVRDGTLLTAPAGPYILRGITRDIVLDLARTDSIPADERFFDRDELFGADEAFVTSTNMEVLPITTIDGQRIGTGHPGPVTQRLGQLYTAETVRVQAIAGA